MRQIGTLPKNSDPRVLGDYLLSLGMTSRAIESNDGWAIWIHNEDHVPKAREVFSVYEQNPNDPRFADAAHGAAAARRESERLDRQYHKNVRDLSSKWGHVSVHSRPLTMFLVAVCVGLFVAGGISETAADWFNNWLLFFPISALANPHDLTHGLDAIRRGEVWRLVTPIFLHGGIIHLLFNMWALLVIGTIIEVRRGTSTLLALVAVSAITSNVVQYLFLLNFDQRLTPWVGISGVVYALFGYLWMKGRIDPEPGMVLHPSTVRIMLLWLMLGFLGAFQMQGGGGIRMANGAHLGGLVIGMLFGLARF